MRAQRDACPQVLDPDAGFRALCWTLAYPMTVHRRCIPCVGIRVAGGCGDGGDGDGSDGDGSGDGDCDLLS